MGDGGPGQDASFSRELGTRAGFTGAKAKVNSMEKRCGARQKHSKKGSESRFWWD